MERTVPVKFYQGAAEEKSALARICQEWSQADFWPYEEFLLSMKIPGTFLLFQSENNHWLSLALGRAMGGEVELFYIYVSPGERRRGLADQLLAEFCEHARHDWACERIILEVRPSNLAAQSLYAKQGFENMARRRRYYPDGEDALIYEKTIRTFDA